MRHSALLEVRARVWEPAGLACADIVAQPESAAYCGLIVTLVGRRAVFRSAKATPIKAGQFATVWQRSDEGPILPFDTDDGVELFVVQAGFGAGLGHFVFPTSALVRHGVVSVDWNGGKRAMRVYPPDVECGNAQYRRTSRSVNVTPAHHAWRKCRSSESGGTYSADGAQESKFPLPWPAFPD